MFGSGREVIPNVCKWLGVLPGCPGVAGRPSRISGTNREASWMSGNCGEALRMSESGRETLPVVREWWVALPEVRELSRASPRCPGGPLECARVLGSGRKAIPNVRN